MHGYVDVVCNICHFAQPLQNRPDVQSMKKDGSGAVPLQQVPPQGAAAGGGGGPPPGWGNAPPPGQQPMRYG